MSLAEHLLRLGLGQTEVDAYAWLLQSGPAPLPAIAESLGAAEGQIKEAVDRLTRIGLIGLVGDDGMTVAPVSPTAATELLARRRESELREAQVAALNAYETFRRTVWPQATDGLLEVVSGADIQVRLGALENNVQTSVWRMDSPPYFFAPSRNPREMDNLGRGIEYRVVYSKSAVELPGYYENNIRPSIAEGENARTLPRLPVKLTIYDQRVASVSLSITEADINRSVLLVHPSSLLSALVGLFELTWRAALPMHVGDRLPSPLRPVERQILELLSIGLADEAIADRIKVSRRTLTRHVERLMSRAGVATRFQLGLFANRSGWI